MRKSKIKIVNVEEPLFLSFITDPQKSIERLGSLSITLPEWAKLVLLVLHDEQHVLEASFYEDAKDFFVTYTKKVLRNTSSPNFICFSREGSDWKYFIPPTLIGTNLRTKLRKL